MLGYVAGTAMFRKKLLNYGSLHEETKELLLSLAFCIKRFWLLRML